MIQQMRNNAAVIMWVVIIAFVATIVFAWGMDLTTSPRNETFVGKVNKQEIDRKTFERLLDMERQKEQERSNGSAESPYQSKMLPRQVWETEVNRILLREVFTKMHLGASSDQLFEYIKRNPPREVYTIPQFQTDSMFDTSKFIQFLNNPQAYENQGMRMLEQHTREMLIPMQTLQALLSMQGQPSRSEIAYEYRMENEKAVFEYAKLTPQSFKIDSTEMLEPAIDLYYKAHTDSFYSDEQAELYFVKIPKIATDNDAVIISNELLEIFSRIKNSDSLFQEEAKIESDDEGTASHGGDLGWVTQGSLGPQFDSAVFSLPLNTVSKPIRTQFGFHLILVEKREKKGDKLQAKVRHILRKIGPSGETLDRLNDQADSLHKLIAADGIKAVMKKPAGVIFDSTGLFRKGDIIPKTGYLSNVGSFTFSHEVDEVSDILENEDGYFIFQIKQKLKKGLQPLSVVRERIVQKLTDSLLMEKARKLFMEDLNKLRDKNNILELSKIDPSVVTGRTDTVSQGQYINQIGFDNQAVAAAFTLPIGTASNLISTKDALFIVKPLWQKKITDIPWNSSEIVALRQKLESQTMQKIYFDWYLNLKNRAHIIDNLNKFYLD